MPDLRRESIVARHLLLVVALVAFAGCDGLTCSGQGFELTTNSTFPDEQIVEPALQLRVTREGSEFLQAHGTELLQGLLGGDGEVQPGGWIDLSDLLNDYLEQNPIDILGLSVRDLVAAGRLPNPDGLRIQFLEDPDRIRVIIEELWLRIEATAVDDNTGAACRVRGELHPGADQRMFTVYDIVLDIELATTAEGGFDVSTSLVELDIVESGIDVVTDSADPDYYCHFPECQDGANGCDECESVCNTVEFVDDVANFFVSAFDTLVATVIETVADTVLDQVEQLEARIHPALLLGSVLDDLYDAETLRLGVRPAPNGFDVTRRVDIPGPGGDLDVRLSLGVMASAVHPCVPPPVGAAPTFTASPLDALPASSRGSELVVGVPAGFVDQLLWSLQQSGALCLEIDAATVADITGGALDLSAGLLSLLLPGLEKLAPSDAPLLLVLRPRIAGSDLPVVRFGTGEVHDDGTVDSLIQVALANTAIGIYAGIDDEFVQLFEVQADLAAGVTPLVNPDGSLGVGIDAIEVTNLVESYDVLFRDVELQSLLEFVVELLSRVLVGNDISLPLPIEDLVENLLGVPVRIGLSNFAAAGSAGDWLTLSIGLEYGGQGGSGGPVDTRLEEVAHGDVLTLAAGSELALTLGSAHDGEPLEAQMRLDGLAWTGFRPGPQLRVSSHLLDLPGTHTLELRARRPGRHATTDGSPMLVTLEVVAADPAMQAPASDALDTHDGGCAAVSPRGASPSHTPWLLAVLLCAGLVWRHRRGARRLAPLASVLLVSLGCSEPGSPSEVACDSDRDCAQGQLCGCDGTCQFPSPCASNADCCGGRACIDGVCESSLECRDAGDCASGFDCESCQCVRRVCGSSSDCPAPLSCRDGLCAPVDSVPCDAACDEGQVCLAERDTCLARTNICPMVSCEPGELATLIDAGGFIGEQCGFEGGACECRASPPLRGPNPGGYVSVVDAAGRLVIASYEPDYGDLVVMRANSDLKVTSVEFVDGVPDVRPTAAVDGPRGGIGLPGPDVGRHASAAIAPDGTVAIASYDTAGALRLAWQAPGTDTWTRLTVDDTGDAGRYASIAALPDGRYAIAYQVVDATNAQTMLRVATSTGSRPAGSGDFVLTNVEVAPGVVGSGLVSGTGVDPVALVDVDAGTILVPFYRADAGELVLARGPATGPFEVVVVDAGANRAGFGRTDVGRGVSAVRDTMGRLHLAYRDEVAGSLRYGRFVLSTDTLEASEEITGGLAMSPPAAIGGVALSLGLDAQPRVAWQDTSVGKLSLARRDASGTWTSAVVDDSDVSGFSPSFTASGGVLAFGRIRAGASGSAPFREIGIVRVE